MFTDKLFWFGLASIVANIIGYYPYITAIIKNVVKPQRITWGIWTLLVTIAFVNQIHNGGGYSSYFIGSTLVLVATVFILSFKYGVGGGSKLDIASLLAALVLFIAWAITKDTRVTTIIVVLIDGVGAIPTLHKAFKQPQTEAYLQWLMAMLGSVFAIMAVYGGDYILTIYPLYVIFMDGAIVAAKYFGTIRIQAKAVKQH